MNQLVRIALDGDLDGLILEPAKRPRLRCADARHGPSTSQDEDLLPLVVDLDGTLVHTDTLAENALAAAKASPHLLALMPLWLARGRAELKSKLATQAAIPVETLPYNQALISFLRDERARGRRIILATAAHESVAERVAAHLDVFDDVLASGAGCNLKGTTKLAAILSRVGEQFIYIGDHRADLPIWERAEVAMYAGPAGRSRALDRIRFEREFDVEPATLQTWIKALRVHQWLKNLLLFVPLLTSFSFGSPAAVWSTVVAFVAFGLLASATYIVNDLLDLTSDRAHPRKRRRPFAAGRLSIAAGVGACVLLLAGSAALAATLPRLFGIVLLAYLAITLSYSFLLKRYVLIDVVALAVLYTVRIIAGASVCAVVVSPWLLAFSVCLFFSLALMKRCSELVSLGAAGRSGATGRDYQVGDLAALWPLGASASTASAVVFALFISAPATQARYATPELLWLSVLVLMYWLGRLWIKTVRGEMHDDPIVFAARDRGCRFVFLIMTAIVVAAHELALDLLISMS